jgi:hypothetical protein
LRVYLNIKQAGTRKNYVTKEELDLNFKPSTLRGLIGEIVKQNVQTFNKRIKEKPILEYLTDEEINSRILGGKISFGELYNDNTAKLDKALECAFLAYEDGIFRVLVGNKETGCLDDALELEEDDVLTFIRLTMLVGRMW